MNAVSLIKAMIEPGGRAPIRGGGRLQPGDRLLAKVLDIGKDGMARLDLGRFTAMAALRTPVSTGMHLSLEVVESAGQLILKIRERKRRQDPPAAPRPAADASGADTDAARRQLFRSLQQLRGLTRWASLPSAREGLPHLLRLLTPLNPMTASVKDIAARIQESIEDSGLFFESRLARRLEADGRPDERTRAMPSDRENAPLSAVVRRDAKAVALQILSDLKKAPTPLPPALALLEKNAAGLLSDIQGHQRNAMKQRFSENTERTPLVYGPRHGAAARSTEPDATSARGPEAWWRVTGEAPPVSKLRAAAPRLKAPHLRRGLLKTAETVALALARSERPLSPSQISRDEGHLVRVIRTYTRRPASDTGIHIPTGWRRLERLAAALSNTQHSAAITKHPLQAQRLSETLVRLIRHEIERFDSDLHLLGRMVRGQLGEDMAPGSQRRAGGAPGESGQVLGFTIPMAPPDQPVRLHVYYPPRKQTDAPGTHQVALLLSLTPMGDVRAEVSLTPEGLRVTLRLSEARAMHVVRQHQGILEAALAPLAPSLRIDTHQLITGPDPSGGPQPSIRPEGSGRVNVDV
ncbi:MAG: hypothetical protein ABIL58_05480 [Pseudomonadota bacterium]